MEIRPYGKTYPGIITWLIREGVLRGYPVQIKRDDLRYDEGIDVKYSFKGMTPAKFKEYADFILLAAFTEAQRYKDEKFKFAKFDTVMGLTAKGRKTLEPHREYTAARHTDANIMVYGEAALGYTLPEEFKRKPFLVNKIQEILDIPLEYSPQVTKQMPFKVVTMTISIRAGKIREIMPGLREEKEKEEKE